MKKLVALLLATAMMFTCVACGGNNGDNGDAGNDGAAKVEITDATELLTKVWTEYTQSASEDVQFPIGGGDAENMTMEAPGKYDATVEGGKDGLTFQYCIPADVIDMSDDFATGLHMMMANNFSAAAYHIADKANVEKVVNDIKDKTMNNQWMCGFPEKLIIVTVNDDYVVSAFGNGQVIEAFKTAITTVYGKAAVVSVEENLAQ